jgi:hypothetical protein
VSHVISLTFLLNHVNVREPLCHASVDLFLQIYQFFQATGENHAELQSTELQTYEIVLLKFLLFVLKILSVPYIMSKILVL